MGASLGKRIVMSSGGGRRGRNSQTLLARLFAAGLLMLLVLRIFISASPGRFRLDVSNGRQFEQGISYRNVQWHGPIGPTHEPVFLRGHLVATIDWNDGTGEHKPDTNAQDQAFSKIQLQ